MNDTTFLHPEFKHKILELEKLCQDNNITFKITDTFRTESEQNFKYVKGRLSFGKICTTGQYPNNYHCWGLAIDIESDHCEVIGRLAESIGLIWGGNNTEYKNINHLEYPMETLKFLRLTYGSYKKFRLTWDPMYSMDIATTIITDPLMIAANKNTQFIKDIQMACNMDGFRTKGKKILTISGRLDDETLDALSKVKMELNKRYSLIKKIQILLTKLGYRLVMTGKYDNDTKNNIIRFQRSCNLSPSGAISKELIIVMLSQ